MIRLILKLLGINPYDWMIINSFTGKWDMENITRRGIITTNETTTYLIEYSFSRKRARVRRIGYDKQHKISTEAYKACAKVNLDQIDIEEPE